MTRIRQERSAVGKHAYKRADMPRSGKIVEVLIHSDFVVEEPPRRSVLHFAFRLVRLETA